MIIEDGVGTGRKAKVTTENLLATLSITSPVEHHVNHEDRRAYNCVVEQTSGGAGYYFFYLKNTGDDDLIITSIQLYTPSVESINFVLLPAGTAVGTTYVPINKYCGSANTADADCVVGNNITGLSGGSLVDRLVINGATIGMINIDWISNFIVPKNTSIAFSAVTGSIKVNMTLSIFFHSPLLSN